MSLRRRQNADWKSKRSDVVEALGTLVRGGLAKAYELSGYVADPFSGEIPGMPSLDHVEQDFKTYFYATKKGIEFQQADRTSWPFDDEGELRPDWSQS